MKILISLAAGKKMPPISAAPFREFLLSLGIPSGVSEKLAGDGIAFRRGAYEKRIALRTNAIRLRNLLTTTLGTPDEEPEMSNTNPPKPSGNTSYVWDIPGKGFISLDINQDKQCTFNVVPSSQFKARR